MFIIKKNQTAFTLMELLVVIAVISILAGMIMVSMSGSRQKARDTRRKSDLDQIALVLEQYYDNQSPNQYVTAETKIDINGSDDALTVALSPTYLKEMPLDPLAPDQYYHYQSFNSDLDYRLEAVLENENDPQGEAYGLLWVFVVENN